MNQRACSPIGLKLGMWLCYTYSDQLWKLEGRCTTIHHITFSQPPLVHQIDATLQCCNEGLCKAMISHLHHRSWTCWVVREKKWSPSEVRSESSWHKLSYTDRKLRNAESKIFCLKRPLQQEKEIDEIHTQHLPHNIKRKFTYLCSRPSCLIARLDISPRNSSNFVTRCSIAWILRS